MDHNQSKQELEKQINQKNLKSLNQDDALNELFIFNLQNFAYRYLETENSKDIKCQTDGKTFWVESIETDVFTALKWDNKDLKPKLIELCKQYPGQKSKKIHIKLMLGTTISGEKEVTCFSLINWNFPNFDHNENELCRIKKFQYSDRLDLRNNHAALLEEVAEIF
jgi:hypothetical protein